MKEKIYKEVENKLYNASNIIAATFAVGGLILQIIGLVRDDFGLREMAAYITLLSAGYLIGVTSTRKIFKEVKKK